MSQPEGHQQGDIDALRAALQALPESSAKAELLRVLGAMDQRPSRHLRSPRNTLGMTRLLEIMDQVLTEEPTKTSPPPVTKQPEPVAPLSRLASRGVLPSPPTSYLRRVVELVEALPDPQELKGTGANGDAPSQTAGLTAQSLDVLRTARDAAEGEEWDGLHERYRVAAAHAPETERGRRLLRAAVILYPKAEAVLARSLTPAERLQVFDFVAEHWRELRMAHMAEERRQTAQGNDRSPEWRAEANKRYWTGIDTELEQGRVPLHTRDGLADLLRLLLRA